MPTESPVVTGACAIFFIAGWLLGVLAWYHSVRMFLNRQSGVLPYIHPLWFLADRYLNQEGISHRAKFGRYFAASATCFALAFLMRELGAQA